MNKRWSVKIKPPIAEVKALAEAIKVDRTLATLLVQRGVHTFDDAKSFFRPSLENLHDPFLMKDMDKAINRIGQAIAQREKILIYGDYDVDGTTSVALMYGFLRTYHTKLDFYIPDRHTEGYGISKQGIDWAAENDFSLIIALDCGIKSVELVTYAQNLGVEFIICDHHLPGEELPPACAVLDPKRPDCQYPYKELSACGVGFKLLEGFCLKNQIEVDRLYEFLDLVVVSIASDLVPMTGENRILAFYGLQRLNNTPRAGLKALTQIAGFTQEVILNIRNLVFAIGPRINAAGRIEHAKQAVQLLLANHEQEAQAFANQIDLVNATRQDLDQNTTQEALEMIRQLNGQDRKSTVLFKSDWHKGVVGIVASRCIEHYHRPTVILSQYGDKVTGSARSVPGFDLYAAVLDCADLLDAFGGHQQAAGLTMPIENVEAFKERFEEAVAKRISPEQLKPLILIDAELELEQIQAKFYRILRQFAPFGPGNMRPLFASYNLIAEYPKVLKDKHLKFRVRKNTKSRAINVIAFGMSEYYPMLLKQQAIDLCYTVEQNHYMGKTSLQLRAKDIKLSKN